MSTAKKLRLGPLIPHMLEVFMAGDRGFRRKSSEQK